MIAKLLDALERATDPRNRIDVSDLTTEQFVDLLSDGYFAAEQIPEKESPAAFPLPGWVGC